MTYYLRSAYRASVMRLRRGSEYDKARSKEIRSHNLNVISSVLFGLNSGAISYAHTTSNGVKYVLTRSSRGDYIQITHFVRVGNTWEPSSHIDAYNASDVYMDLPDGRRLFTVA